MQYYQSISRFDTGVGRLLDVIEETGHKDDTLILLLSDNGPPFPGAKTTLYEPGINLPLIIRDPRHKQTGTTCDALVTWTDITPTVLDLCVAVKPAPGPDTGEITCPAPTRRSANSPSATGFRSRRRGAAPKPRIPTIGRS